MNDSQGGMVTVYRSGGPAAETEAETIKSLLEANGVEALVTGMDVLPGATEVAVQVTAARKELAERLITEALAAGPAAAEEAEREGEITS